MKKKFIDELMMLLTEQGYKPRLARSEKLNYSNQEIIILETEGDLCPVVYIDSLFDDFIKGRSMADILTGIESGFNETDKIREKVNVNSLDNWENVKDSIFYRVFSKSRNNMVLTQSNIPYFNYLDLIITFYIQCEDENLTIPVTETLLNVWGITRSDMLDAAIKNSERDNWFYIKGLFSILNGMIESGSCDTIKVNGDKMYVLSNRTGRYGAGGILNKEILERAYKMFADQNYYILPSSIHELILVPDDDTFDIFELKEMVLSVNQTIVEPTEWLSDSVYYYSHEFGEVKMLL